MSTRERVLDAAEELIAERGIGNVSVRDITARAGANTAAVNYHFGTKDGLFAAIVDRAAERFGARRSVLLADAGDPPTLTGVARAMVVATAELAADEHGSTFLRCKHRMRADPVMTEVLAERFEPYTKAFLDALAEATPHLDADERALRFALTHDAVDLAFANPILPTWLRQQAGKKVTHKQLTDRMVDFVVAAFS